MRPTPRFRLAALLLTFATVLLLGSCATRLPPPEPVDVLGPLSPQALFYVEARGSDVSLIARELESGTGADKPKLRDALRSIRGLADRGRLFGLALLPGQKSDAARPNPLPAFEATVAGNFSSFGLWFNFIGARDWRRTEGRWENRSMDLGVALPRQGLLVAARGDVRPLAARALSKRPTPIPEAYAKLVDEGLVAWIPDPIQGLGPGLGLETSLLAAQGLPTFDLLLVARTETLKDGAPGSRDALDLDLAILPRDGASARLLLPAIRLGWYFLADKLPFEGKPSFKAEGDALRIGGLRLPLARLAAIVEKGMKDEGVGRQ
ncbi:MAG TPA: hypothetical protein VMV83_14500 [Rectinemataceae bacterium]|nr:hypothetical protein [Rectinemataceae bacterium]